MVTLKNLRASPSIFLHSSVARNQTSQHMLGDLRGSSQSVIKAASLLLSLKTNPIWNGARYLPPNTVLTCMLLRRNSSRLRIYSGAGNSTGFSPSPSLHSKHPSVVSWNARALAHHNLQLRQQKVNAVLALCRQYTVVALLEVHGSLLAQQSILARCLRSHFLFCSQVKDCHGFSLPDAGGICILVSRSLFAPVCAASNPIDPPPPPIAASFSEIECGRAVQLSIVFQSFLQKGIRKSCSFSLFITLVFPLSLPGTL